ncbi:MAG: hypothetical protein KDA70_13420 [Planctomycetaceae bacterium]|nr:hypothetical protein [Planctomycetaceae bacterium]
MAHAGQEFDEVLFEPFLPFVVVGLLTEIDDLGGSNAVQGDELIPLIPQLDFRISKDSWNISFFRSDHTQSCLSEDVKEGRTAEVLRKL